MPDQTVLPPAPPRRPTRIRNIIPRLPERGHIKIGGLGKEQTSAKGGTYRMPVKLDHFRITTLERGEDGNFVIDRELHDKLGLGDTPTEIPIRLLYDDPDLSFPTRYACYVGKTLWCSGDGEMAQRRSADPTKPPLPEPLTVTCPCNRQDPAYKGADKCKMNGRLSAIIDGAGSVGGVWVLRTTSYNSVTGIQSSLDFLRHVTGGILANLPLVLRLQPKQAVSPVDGKPVLVYVVSVEYAGQVSELMQAGHQIALDRAHTHLSIEHIEDEARRMLSLPGPQDAILPGDIPDDVIEEFYPEQNAELAPMPARPTRESLETATESRETTELEVEAETTYPVINADGEEEDISPGALVAYFDAVFQESAKRGYLVWLGVGQSNKDLIETLKVGDPDEVALAGKIAEAYKAHQPEKPVRQTSATTQPQTDTTSEPTIQRADFWGTDSFAIVKPLKADKSVNWQTLRDTMMILADQAQTPVELAKFVDDNQQSLRALGEAFKTYLEIVNRKFAEVGKRLGAKE